DGDWEMGTGRWEPGDGGCVLKRRARRGVAAHASTAHPAVPSWRAESANARGGRRGPSERGAARRGVAPLSAAQLSSPRELHAVADAAYGDYAEAGVGGPGELLLHAGDEVVDGAGVDHDLRPPDGVQDLVAGEGASGVLQ